MPTCRISMSTLLSALTTPCWDLQQLRSTWRHDGEDEEAKLILLMEDILHHLGCIKPCKWWDKLPTSTGDFFHQQYYICSRWPSMIPWSPNGHLKKIWPNSRNLTPSNYFLGQTSHGKIHSPTPKAAGMATQRLSWGLLSSFDGPTEGPCHRRVPRRELVDGWKILAHQIGSWNPKVRGENKKNAWKHQLGKQKLNLLPVHLLHQNLFRICAKLNRQRFGKKILGKSGTNSEISKGLYFWLLAPKPVG